MRILQILVLCTFSYVGALDIFVDGPVLLLDCRSQEGPHPIVETSTASLVTEVETTAASLVTEAPVDPKGKDKYIWSKEVKACILSDNDKELSTRTVEECQNACEKETDFLCQSVNYVPEQELCVLNKQDSKNLSYKQLCPVPNDEVIFTKIIGKINCLGVGPDYFAHPWDCHKFYHCSSPGAAVEEGVCSEDEAWSQDDHSCVGKDQDHVDCWKYEKKELFDAARDGDISFINDAISRLSSSGLDLNWRNPDYWEYTALHIATAEYQTSIVAALLDAGADPDAHTDSGETPVLRAVYVGHTAALKLLLAHGADPNKVHNDGTSPLIKAQLISYDYGRMESTRMLIQAGAHVDYVNPSDGRTALHWAAMDTRPDAALLLLQNGADKSKRDNDGYTPADWARMRGDDSVVQVIDNY